MADDATLFDFDSGGADGDGGGPKRPAGEAEAVVNGGSAPVVDASDYRYPDAEGYVELAVMQVDYTVEGSGSEEYPVLHVFGRTADDEVEHVRVREFKPYFYTPTASLSGPPEEKFDRITGSETTDADGEPYESIRGERLTKVFGQTPRDVGQLRDRFDHYEADILFPNRLLIDKDITSGVRVPAQRAADGAVEVHHEQIEAVDVEATPRVCTFDIEVDDRSGFPEDGEETVVCLTSHDSYTDEYVNWIFAGPEGVDPPESLEGFEPLSDGASYELRAFEDEQRMLASFVDYVDERDFDVLTGWNFTDFDAPYLLDRLEVLGGSGALDPDRLSRVGEVWRSDWQGPNIKGRVVFDLLYAYKRTQFTELESYRLDAVGEAELGVGKERYAGDIGDLWEEDPERLLEYNTRDVELCVELDRKQEIVPFWQEVASFVGCKLEDAPTPGDAVDMYVLHKVHGEFALPSKGAVDAEEYAGGAVFEPITGVKEMVSVLDLASLYPMCMVTINASPETKVGEGYDGATYRAPNGMEFRKEPDGIIREMVTELLEEREEKKALRDDHDPGSSPFETYDRQQSAVKVIMNCFTPDTEVLTPSGLRGIRELEVGDEVYSLDPETMAMEVKPVVETHAYPDYRGELVDIETSKMDFRVTPNHRMLVRKNERNGISEEEYSFVEAGELDAATNYELPHDWDGPGGEPLKTVDITELLDGEYEVWANNEVHGHTLAAEVGWYPDKVVRQAVGDTGYVFSAEEFERHREYLDEVCSEFYVHKERGRKWVPRFYDGDDFLDLLAWYITEGHVYSSSEETFGENRRGRSTTVGIAQDAIADGGVEDDHTAIRELLDRMGLDAYVDENGFQFTSRLLGELLATTCGDGSANKRVPEFVFGFSRRQKRRFLDTLISGDGEWQADSWRYSTASEQLRDGVLRLCAHLGLTTNYNQDSGVYRIYTDETSKNTLRMHRSAERTTAEDGVYCVTVEDNHTLLAGRNGKLQFVGQSLYGVLGWDRFRLYDKDMGAAVTATGRRVIEYTEEVADELDSEVIYGDTDSVMLEFGHEMSKQEAIERSFELEELINDSYDELAAELNAEQHRFEIEFEKLYRRFFQAGKKKRYAGHIVWSEGKDVDDIDITGFEYKRSDIAPVTKEVQEEVLRRIVTSEAPPDELRDEITEYVHGVIQRFKNGEVSVEEVGIPGGIGKKLDNYDTDTAQVRGAKYANLLLGTNFGRGSKPKRVYLDGVHYDFFRRFEEENPALADDPLYVEFKENQDVVCIEYADQLPEEFQVNWDAMLEKTLKGPIARVLEAIDVSWEEVESGQEQTGLEQYF